MDYLCCGYIERNEPWLLPPETGHDREHWDKEVSAAEEGLGIRGGFSTFPWLKYLQACKDCASMYNRKRIWNVAWEFEEIARGHRNLLQFQDVTSVQ
jgi:hypothetical protein